jgi:hypothetical protein
MLSVGTILFFNLYDRYLVIGPELIMNNLFHNNLAQWEYSVQGVSILSPDVNTVRLNSENPANDIYLSQTIPDVARYSLLRLECDIKTRDIPQVQGSWDSVRIALISHDPSGVPMYKLPHALVNLHGTHDWQHHEGVFLVSNNTVMVRLSVQLAQATGTLWVKNFSLRPLVERTSYRTFRSVVTLLWATAALWILVPIAQSAYRDTHRIVLIAVALAILCGALMPERQKEHIGNFLFPSLVKPAISPHAPAVFNFSPLLPTLDIYKAGHFVLFFTLAAAAFYRRPYPVTRAQMLVYLLLFALVTEILQLLVSGRTAQLGDVIIDGAGIATGFMLLRVMQTTQE